MTLERQSCKAEVASGLNSLQTGVLAHHSKGGWGDLAGQEDGRVRLEGIRFAEKRVAILGRSGIVFVYTCKRQLKLRVGGIALGFD